MSTTTDTLCERGAHLWETPERGQKRLTCRACGRRHNLDTQGTPRRFPESLARIQQTNAADDPDVMDKWAGFFGLGPLAPAYGWTERARLQSAARASKWAPAKGRW